MAIEVGVKAVVIEAVEEEDEVAATGANSKRDQRKKIYSI